MYDRSIHSFVAWMAILNMALVASLPMAMYAAEPQLTASATAPSVISGVDVCIQRCELARNRCTSTSASGTEENRALTCNAHAKDCYALCSIVPKLGLPALVPKDTLKKPETRSASSSSEEARAKVEAKKKLDLAKKRVNEFSRNLASIKLKIAQLEKKGLSAPPGLKDAVAAGEALVKQLKAAATPEEVQAIGDVQSMMEAIATQLKTGLVALEKGKTALKKFASIEAQLRAFDHQIATMKKLSGNNAALATQIADVEKALADLKTTYRQAHDMIAAGNVDEGFKLLETQVPTLTTAYKEAVKTLYKARAEKTKS